MSFLLNLVLQITAAVTGQHFLSYTVRVGDEVSLPCENVMQNKHNCENTTWLFSDSRSTRAEELIKLGQIGEIAKDKSDRLSVTENCSLVIKKVTREDVGQFNCQQFNMSGKKQSQDSVVLLSVINMTEQKEHNKITVNCSVFTYGDCQHTVTWLFKGKDVDKDLRTSESYCSASVTFTESHFITSNDHELLTCEVTDGHTKEVHQFTFSPPQSSDWWWYVLVPVGLAALLITVVAVVRWRRTKTNVDDNIADPEDDVLYTSISYTRKTSKAKVRVKDDDADDHDDDGGNVVTYSTVKVSSAVPSHL